jgi:hypothetical protein
MCSSRILRLFLACLFVSTIFSLTSNAQTFSQKNYPAATPAAGSLARADLNHDGFADIVNGGGTDIFVLLNKGDGSFRAAASYAAGGNVGEIKTADVNGDTHPDVVYSTLDSDQTGHISILYGKGDGSFGAPAPLSRSFPQFHNFDLADFNRDGKTDIVVAFTDTDNSEHLTVMFGDGTSFSNPLEFSGIGKTPDAGENSYYLTSVAAGDFNGDGNPDIAIGEGGGGFDVLSGSVSVFYGKGNGTFGQEVFEGGASGLFAIKTVNVNNDGIDDLAVFFAGCHTPCEGITLVYGNSAGLNHGGISAVPPFDGPDAPPPSSIVFADVNGDGLPDVIAAGTNIHEDGTGAPAISVNVQQSDGSFKRASLVEMASRVDGLLAGDFNGDGKWDFVSSNDTAGTISVFTNTTAGIGCASPSANRTLNVCTPASGATVTSPVLFRANARTTTEISGLRIYVDGVSKFLTHDSPLTARLIVTPGTHSITVKVWDATEPFSKTISLKVSGDSGTCQPASSARAVTICTPNPSDWQPTSVHLTANANGKNVTSTQVYVDGTLKFQTSNFALDTQLTLAEGKRRITVKGWDSSGAFSTTVNVWVYGGRCKPAVAPGGRGLTVCSPKKGVTYNGAVPIQAIAVGPNPITNFTMQWENSQPESFPQGWVDEVSVGPPGNNTWKFVAMDSQGTMSSTVTVLVTNSSCPAPSTRTVIICSPSNGQTVSGTFSLNATAGKPTGAFKALQIYNDGVLWYTTDTQFFSIATALPAGTHRITAKGWDGAGAYSTTINITSTGN